MREERIARSLSSALAALAVLFAPLYLLSGLAFARSMLLYGAGCAVAGVLAAWLFGKRNPALQILLTTLPAAALALVPAVPGGQAVRYFVAVAGSLLAVWCERLSVTAPSSPLRPGVLLAPLVSLIAASIVLLFTSRSAADANAVQDMLLFLFAAWFVVAALLMNRMALKQAARAANDSGIPSGVRRKGAAGAFLFAAVTLVLACIGTIVSFIGDAISALIRWFIQAFVWLTNLFAPEPAKQTAPPANPGDMLPKPEGGQTPLAELITNIIITVVLIAVAVAILYGLYRLFPKLWKKLRERLAALFSGWRADEDFSDRTESLLSFRQALHDAGAGFRRFARRFRRKTRISDYPTNAGKARFLFREYLRRLIEAGREPPPSATATEIAAPAPALARAYNLARYGEEEPQDGEIEKAKEEISP